MSLPPRLTGRRQAKKAEASAHVDSHIPRRHICVIGGGIAGVCCAQEISRLNPEKEIVLISCTDVLREVTSIMKLTSNLEEISVFERCADQFTMDNHNIKVIIASLDTIEPVNKELYLSNGERVLYSQVCICTGSQPKTLLTHATPTSPPPSSSTNTSASVSVSASASASIITIRDLESVQGLAQRLQTAHARSHTGTGTSTIAVIGNGGIAMELVNALSFCQVEWIVKDAYVGSAFFDATAAAFIAPTLMERIGVSSSSSSRKSGDGSISGSVKRKIDATATTVTGAAAHTGTGIDTPVHRTGMAMATEATADPLVLTVPLPSVQHHDKHKQKHGSALGPEWLSKSAIFSHLPQSLHQQVHPLHIHYNDEVVSISSKDKERGKEMDGSIPWLAFDSVSLTLETKTGKNVECDFVVCAIGVVPSMPGINVAVAVAAGTVTDTVTDTGTGGSTSAFAKDREGYLLVDARMQTNFPHVYAAGDCCTVRKGRTIGKGKRKVSSEKLVGESKDDHGGDKQEQLREEEDDEDEENAHEHHSHWFQMKLWSQARTMGHYAAQCMHEELLGLTQEEEKDAITGRGTANDIAFEVFAHVTRFFGYKVVLLGRYNAQGLGVEGGIGLGAGAGVGLGRYETCAREMVVSETGLLLQTSSSSSSLVANMTIERPRPGEAEGEGNKSTYTTSSHTVLKELEIWTRVSPGIEYIKVIVFRGRVVGALMLGDTELEEVFENLILNRMDVSDIGVSMLDPNFDLEGYMD